MGGGFCRKEDFAQDGLEVDSSHSFKHPSSAVKAPKKEKAWHSAALQH